MSFFKRLGNVVKGSVRTAGRADEAHLTEAALTEELARVTPGQEARERLAALKGQTRHRPGAEDGDTATDDQAARLRALARRFESGEIDQRTYDEERARVLHGPSGVPERTL